MLLKSWIKDKIEQRNTWSGIALIGVGLIVLLASSLAKFAAIVAIAWGVWAIWEEQTND
jgi:hypothetical protein|tara:strand:- start:581 stop:757 length:177 start_codon:yes stop_codon:yes gene_type:complete